MINPSATGWIDKFFLDQKSLTNPVIENPDFFYSKVRHTGFIYGYIISLQTPVFVDNKGWTEDEITEVLLQLMGYVGAPKIREAMQVAVRVFEAIQAE